MTTGAAAGRRPARALDGTAVVASPDPGAGARSALDAVRVAT